MVSPMLHIRPLNPNDHLQWRSLWSAYLRFYRQRLPDEITDATL